MIVSTRPFWLLHVVLVFAATVAVLRADASVAAATEPSIRVTTVIQRSPLRSTPALAALAALATDDAPLARASSRLASWTHATWQRGSRRPHRTATSQLTGAERAPGTAFGATPARRVDAPVSARLHHDRRDDRRRGAPPRAPPNDC
ncbi:hypothetical protein [Gemmatimonas sp.]|uniref:hypothetical protein n=1 Tax=Gemmatimonas sp. TaxID=1962908 RepID=UPI0039830F93